MVLDEWDAPALTKASLKAGFGALVITAIGMYFWKSCLCGFSKTDAAWALLSFVFLFVAFFGWFWLRIKRRGK